MANELSRFYKWLGDHKVSPAVVAGALGLGTWGLSRALWNPGVETLRSMGNPIAKKFGFGDLNKNPEMNNNWQQSMDDMKYNSKLKTWVPILLGAGTTAFAAHAMANRDEPYFGLFKAGMDKSAKLLKEAALPDSYMEDIEWDNRLKAAEAVSLFQNDPHLDGNPYVRNMGTAIVQNAALGTGTTRPTLGSIYNSAVDKISNKLSFAGIADVGLRTMVANTSARLFAGALGAMTGLSDNAKQNIVDAGTWAGAVTAILT